MLDDGVNTVAYFHEDCKNCDKINDNKDNKEIKINDNKDQW